MGNSSEAFTQETPWGVGNAVCPPGWGRCDNHTYARWQLWAKPLPTRAVAVLLIILSPAPLADSVSVSVGRTMATYRQTCPCVREAEWRLGVGR